MPSSECVNILQDLIRIRSYSGEEEDLTVYLQDFARDNKLPCQLQDGNVVFPITSGRKKCLIFNAHMDTVRTENGDLWKYAPYGQRAGVVECGRVYGLGASDMKGSLACLLLLARDCVLKNLASDLFFSFVREEETGGQGSKSFSKFFADNFLSQYQQVACIVTEPTENRFVEIAHRGSAFLEISIRGDTAHAARPSLAKRNAAREMLKLIPRLDLLFEKLAQEHKHEVLGSPSFTLTGISSADHSPNTISGKCSVIVDVRSTPGLLESLLRVLKNELGDSVEVELLNEPCPHSFTDPDSDLVRSMCQIVPDLQVRIAQGANDCCWFTAIGIPAITFGPGLKEVMHRENEYIDIAALETGLGFYRKFVDNF